MSVQDSGGQKVQRLKFWIPLRLPSLNEYTSACRSNKFAGAALKKRTQNDIGYFIPAKEIETPVVVHFVWVMGNQRRDIDNVAFAKKFILDAMVEKGVIHDDSMKYVVGFTDNFEVCPEEGVMVTVETYRRG